MVKLSYGMIAGCYPSQRPYKHFSHSGKTISVVTEKIGRVCMHVKERMKLQRKYGERRELKYSLFKQLVA